MNSTEPDPQSATIDAVVLAGGGTAGHVNPLLSVADEIRRRNPDAEIIVLGTEEGLEADLVPERGYRLWTIPKVPLPRRPSLQFFRLPDRLLAAVKSARAAMDEIHAQVVVGFGGYVSTPAYLAANRDEPPLGRIPVVVHEGNARPGIANRLGTLWAKEVGTTFPTTHLHGGEFVGLPLRAEIAALAAAREHDPGTARRVGAAELGLDPKLPTLLVSGGSTGALSVNVAVAGAARDLLDAGIQVLHLTGKGKDGPVRQALADLRNRPNIDHYHVREYLTDMQLALAAADLVVARAGAGMVSELAALGMPAIYVPLPVGNGEQRLNATPLVEAGGGLLVADDDFTAKWVREHIPVLIKDRERLEKMSVAAREQGRPDAAARLVDLIEHAVAQARQPAVAPDEEAPTSPVGEVLATATVEEPAVVASSTVQAADAATVSESSPSTTSVAST